MRETEFLWGVATSAYQAEGGYNRPDGPQNNWGELEAGGEVAVCGDAADFWHRYEEDFALAAGLGLNAFRLGVEWARVQPERIPARAGLSCSPIDVLRPPADGTEKTRPYDVAALDGYVRMLRACMRRGLEPVVTLHHFTHPSWLGSDPWLEESTAPLFASHVRRLLEYINPRLERPLRWLITVNEPNMLVLNTYLGGLFPRAAAGGLGSAVRAISELLRAHVLAYGVIHQLYRDRGWAAPQVSFNNYCSDLYWSDKMLLDLLCFRERRVPRAGLDTHIREKASQFATAFREARIPLHHDFAFHLGSAAKRVVDWLGIQKFRAEDFAPVLNAVEEMPQSGCLDFVGLDYYDPFLAHLLRLPVLWDHEFRHGSVPSWVMATVTSKWWDWRVLPRGLHFFCKEYARDFGRPVLIAENGMALRRRRGEEWHRHRRDRLKRSDFLRLQVHEVARIVKEGVPLLGYLHWSLFDNYEWGTYTPRFGLYTLNYDEGLGRVASDHLGDRAPEAYADLIREARRGWR